MKHPLVLPYIVAVGLILIWIGATWVLPGSLAAQNPHRVCLGPVIEGGAKYVGQRDAKPAKAGEWFDGWGFTWRESEHWCHQQYGPDYHVAKWGGIPYEIHTGDIVLR